MLQDNPLFPAGGGHPTTAGSGRQDETFLGGATADWRGATDESSPT